MKPNQFCRTDAIFTNAARVLGLARHYPLFVALNQVGNGFFGTHINALINIRGGPVFSALKKFA